jgi:nucleotide-binding universal stress UspA family protein
MLEKIVVPLDGSDLGEMALPWAVEIAAALGSEVDLIGVFETKVEEVRNMQQVYIERKAEQSSAQVLERRPANVTLPAVRAVLLDGNPAIQILDYSDKNDVGLIIMVSHGRSGIMPWPMGSTAAKVAQHLGVPVLVVRADPPPHKSPDNSLFQNILIPLDGSEAGESALPYVKELVQQRATSITLLRVIAPGQHVHTVGGLSYFSFPEQMTQNMRAEATQYLEKVSGGFSGTKAVVRCEVRAGDSAQEIIRSCDVSGTQLVAMSSHGRSGIERWMLGSVSYKVLNSGKTPLLLVKSAPKTRA